MLVSGTLDPDATGTYLRAADYGGRSAWTREDAAWSIWCTIAEPVYWLSPTVGSIPGEDEPGWSKLDDAENPIGIYSNNEEAEGDAVVAEQST